MSYKIGDRIVMKKPPIRHQKVNGVISSHVDYEFRLYEVTFNENISHHYDWEFDKDTAYYRELRLKKLLK